MSILIDRSTRVLVQGITGRDGSFHARSMKAYGTKVVGGVTPGKGGQFVDDMPVFNTVAEGRAATGANATCIFVPAPFAATAILEAANAGIEFIVAITEGVPVLDMSRIWKELEGRPVRLLGANCPGLITPGQSKIGIMPGHITTPGPVGLVSRSGTLTYEVVWALTENHLGQTTCVGIGGDPINGTSFLDVLQMFEADAATEAVVMIGEIGGNDEEVAAEFIRTRMTKPVVGFIAGQTAPPGRRMGHAGAIVTGNSGTAESKIAAFKRAGVPVARITSEIPALIRQALAKRKPARPPVTRKSEDGAKRTGKASSAKTTSGKSAKAASVKTKATANKATAAPSGKTAPKSASSGQTTQKPATSAKRATSSARPPAHGKSQAGRTSGRPAAKAATTAGASRNASERSDAARRASKSQAGTRTETTRTGSQNASRTTVGGTMAKTAAPKKKAAKKAAKKSTAKKAAKKTTKKATKKKVAKKAPAKKATKKATKKRVAKKATKKRVAKKATKKRVAKKAPAKKAGKKKTARKATRKAAKK